MAQLQPKSSRSSTCIAQLVRRALAELSIVLTHVAASLPPWKADATRAVHKNSRLSPASRAIAAASAQAHKEAVADSCLNHEFRGVSVHHFSTELLRKVRAVGLTHDASIYEIEPTVIRPESANTVCPQDGLPGAAYVHTLSGEDHVGPAQLMLSYTWSYSVGDIADSLEWYCAENGLDPCRTYIWACCLCINQHRVKAQEHQGQVVPFSDFESAFGRRVEGIGHILALMSPWKNPEYLKRVWCVFEMYKAISCDNVDITVVTAPREQRALRAALTSVEGIEGIFRTFASVRIEDAEASVQDDKAHILQMVQDGPGRQELNGRISRYLQGWVLQTSECQLQYCRSAADHDLTAQLCTKIGTLMGYFGLASREACLLEEARRLREAHGTIESLDGVELLRKIGQRLMLYEDFDVAEGVLSRAYQICASIGCLESSCGVNLMGSIGRLRFERGDLQGALESYSAAQQLVAVVGVMHYKDEATLLKNTGDALLQLGRWKEADACFQKVADLYSMTGLVKGPACASLLRAQGTLKQLLGASSEALDALTEALHIRQRAGCLRNKSGALLLANLGDTKMELGDVGGAATHFREAKSIYSEICVPERSKSMQELVSRLETSEIKLQAMSGR